jgi:predicted TPR repeat methyltransferase
MLYYGSGQLEELRELYRSWVHPHPDSVTARHMNAALSGETPPERASDEYVRETFNAFADSFDQNLTDLGYMAPQLNRLNGRCAASAQRASRQRWTCKTPAWEPGSVDLC